MRDISRDLRDAMRREFSQALREEEVADKDLATLTKVTPARRLGLE